MFPLQFDSPDGPASLSIAIDGDHVCISVRTPRRGFAVILDRRKFFRYIRRIKQHKQ